MNKYGWLANTHQTVAWVPADDRAWRRYGTVQVDAVIPPEIASVVFAIPAELAASIGSADAALARLDVELNGVSPHALDAASAHLLRAESLSSSRIEGLDLSARKLAEAEFDPATAKRLAREVAANVRAMQRAVELGSGRRPMTAQDVADLHAVLMADVPAIAPGLFRTVQNWIGPTNNPNYAVFVPPPPAELPRLIEDLAAFTNRTDLSPTIQAAIAHAQFEGIHPFVDGNGRVGRCLVGVIIRRRCGIGVFPPVSAGLRRDTSGYFADLRAYQQDSNPWPWARRFAAVTVDACAIAYRLIVDVAALQSDWRERAGRPRRNSIADRIIEVLPAHTLTDAKDLADLLGVDPNVARRGLATLEAVGIVREVAGRRRNRVWRVDEMHGLLDSI